MGQKKASSIAIEEVMTAPTAASSYEALYQRMQEIVAHLEAGELPLAEAMALYEEGIHVAAACQRILDEAELRVQELQTNPTTSLTSDEE